MADTPESLWSRAHEHVKRGEFANAVRDLAACFQMLQAASDPRVYEVHKRWTEVHRMYLEDGQRQAAAPAKAQATSVQAEAEAAANAGDLDKAIALYTTAAQQAPQNELVRERLQELTQAKRRAAELVSGRAQAQAPAAQAQPVVQAVAPATVQHAQPVAAQPVAQAQPVQAEDDWSDIALDESSAPQARPEPAKPQPQAQARATAPAPMAVEDAPVGMQSLDVPFSVGPEIDAFQADDLPVEGTASTPPSATAATSASSAGGASPGQSDVAFLEELLTRVQANRRRVA